MTSSDDYKQMQLLAALLLEQVGGKMTIADEQLERLDRSGAAITVTKNPTTMTTDVRLVHTTTSYFAQAQNNIHEDILYAFKNIQDPPKNRSEYVTFRFNNGVARKVVKATATRLYPIAEITDGS